LSYNKWGRPNPPYVFFKYDSKEWKRIPLSEFPSELKSINVAADTLDDEDKLVSLGFVTAEKIKELNNEFRQPEYSSILREPLPNGGQGGCGELIHTNEGWEGLGFFKLQHSYEACMKYCDSKKVAIQECPCTTIFKAK
jgi:hypothetical protein